MLNGNGEKHHKVSRDTLNGQRLQWIFNISYIQKHLLPYKISLVFFSLPAESIQRLWAYMFNSISWLSVNEV